MKNRIHNKYYKQILLTMFVVSLVPVFFLGYYVFSFVEQQMHAAYRSYSSGLENEKKEFDNSFEHVDVALIRLGVKNTSQEAVNRERTAANFQIFGSMQEELQLISNTEEYLEDLYLVSESRGWVLGNTSFSPLEGHPERERIQTILEMQQPSFWYSTEDALYMCRRVPINAVSGTGMLIAKFDIGYMMREISGADDGTETVVLDKDGRVMAGGATTARIAKEAVAPGQERWTYRDTRIYETKDQDSRYVVFESVSDYNGWQYLTVMPAGVLEGSRNSILWMLALVILGLLVTDVLAVLIASRRLYIPIDDMIRHMVMKNAEITRKLKTEKKDGQQLFLRRVYQGEVTGADREQFEKNGLSIEAEEGVTYYVLVIKYHEYFEDAKDRQLYMFALDNIINELVDEKVRVFPPAVIGALMYMTCRVKSDSDESAVMKIQMQAMMIVTTVKKYMGQHLNIGISQGFSDLSAISMGIEEGRRALQDAMGAEGEVTFFHSRFTASEMAKGHAARQNRIRLLHYMDMGEEEACRQELDRYIQGLSGLYYYLFKLEICKLVSEILNIYEEYGLTPDYGKVGNIVDFDVSKPVNTYDRLKASLWDDLMAPLFAAVCSQAKERDMMQQIVEYIMDNLEKDINLEECARHFNYNANYLSRWFKKKMGVTYTDFITGKKMELCRQLLVDSDISVGELAERFGYSSPQNFIRVFKKYTMLTPGQYRKSEREKAGKRR